MAPTDLITLYGSVGEVVWADAGNGYFIRSPDDVRRFLAEYGAVRVGDEPEPSGPVIASDGGRRSCPTDREGAVWRTRTATLGEPGTDRVARDLRDFLELPERSLIRFVATGDPGSL
ncbi:SMI1/KNR4 family protein [Actinacidiphila sp. bgisy160]|uniref:SMI1/KNR4 family protein n=1 Tax=Actinacidiphila sp. bgisy160 TaxID=3413796 RepID=UPI003D7645AC